MVAVTVDLDSVESNVRSYCRNFPVEFVKASGSQLIDADGIKYLDFLSACGALNYGHNNQHLKSALIEYISSDGVTAGLDLNTSAKRKFIRSFLENILLPRGLNYRLQFTGPTGANAVEAAIKLARKYTGRTNVIAFTNAFHGCSLGALSLTASQHHRSSSSSILNNVFRMPFDGYFGLGVNTADMIEAFLDDPSSGCDPPAAIILETIQGEGGLNAASPGWCQRLSNIARRLGALLIVDDIQAGCGRSGRFFSFESRSFVPDIVVLAKSLSGFGLPFSMLLIRPDSDVWQPGEHNGTFRGNNHAFVTAAAALDRYWRDREFEQVLETKVSYLEERLRKIAEGYGLRRKGRGFMQGLEFPDGATCLAVARSCFRKGLVIETSGPRDEVLKLMPSLIIDNRELLRGLDVIESSVDEVTNGHLSQERTS